MGPVLPTGGRPNSVEIDTNRAEFAMTRAIVLQLPTVMASSFAITLDVLATANRIQQHLGRRPAFEVVTADFTGDRTWSGELRKGDVLITPGLGSTSQAELDRDLAAPASKRALECMTRAAGEGAVVAASCASAFLLAETGLLDGRKATTTWWFARLFTRRFPKVELQADRIVVVDGDFVTGGAAMCQVDVMLRLVGRFAGPELAQHCARFLVLDERRSQVPYMAISALVEADETLAAAERWVHHNLASDFDIGTLASAVALTPRTFARRLAATCGVSPSRFVQRIRVEAATQLLATTSLSVEEISARVGYADASTLRRILKRETGRAPSTLRPRG